MRISLLFEDTHSFICQHTRVFLGQVHEYYRIPITGSKNVLKLKENSFLCIERCKVFNIIQKGTSKAFNIFIIKSKSKNNSFLATNAMLQIHNLKNKMHQ